jgi:hypothetical protein
MFPRWQLLQACSAYLVPFKKLRFVGTFLLNTTAKILCSASNSPAFPRYLRRIADDVRLLSI